MTALGAFEISGPDWSVSFQSRVVDAGGENWSPNRGALPYHILESRADDLHVTVPVPDGESVWIAVMLSDRSSVRAISSEGHELLFTEVSTIPEGGRLLSLDMKGLTDNQSLPLDRASSKFGQPILTLELRNGTCKTLITVLLSTTELYAQITGLPAPEPSIAEHAYRGWRLP
jgi:hypothetical protein